MRPLAVLLGLLLTGCSSLLVRQDDPTAAVAAKIVWRTVLGMSTLGLSEIRMAELRDEANAEVMPDQRLQDYESHLTYLVNNGALTQAEAEDLYQRYAAVVLQEALDLAAGASAPDLWAGYPVYGHGLPAVAPARFRSMVSYPRPLWLPRFGGSSIRWSRPLVLPKTYLSSISSGKSYGRRSGRRR